jgi:histidyl-tRNA synthetase
MAEKPKKPQKLKARLPRGLEDRGPAAISATRQMVEKIREVFERYGFEPVETPAMEFTDALGKFLPDQDRPNEGVFSFQDDDEQWISLRYDLTAPLARYVAENFDALPKPYRSYRAGYVYRNEKPGPGRFRQFMQFDADTVGSASPAADAEMCMMAADTMEALGIPRGSYVVKVNNRKVLDGVMDWLGLGDPTDAELARRRLVVMRALDKYDRLGAQGVRALLGPGRTDESGDHTVGANLGPDQIQRLIWFLTLRTEDHAISKGSAKNFNPILRLSPAADDTGETLERDMLSAMEKSYYGESELFMEGVQEFRSMEALVVASGYNDGRIIIDPSVVRGLEYYTGPVYEVELLLDTKDEKGRPVRFGSVGGGGRYDGLVSRFRGEPVPATGFSIGVSRLQAALTMLGKLDTKTEPGPVVVTVFDRARIADYQRLVAMLRKAKIRAELYLGNQRNMGNQLKYADRRGSPCVIIQGTDELNDPEGPQVIVKDLLVGSTVTQVEKDRDRYLETHRAIQKKVPVSELVGAVQEILNWHGIVWK